MERSGTEVPIAAAPIRQPRASGVSGLATSSRVFASEFCLNGTNTVSFGAADLHRSRTSGSCKTSLDRSCGFFQPCRYATACAGGSVCALSDVVCRKHQRDALDLFWMYA